MYPEGLPLDFYRFRWGYHISYSWHQSQEWWNVGPHSTVKAWPRDAAVPDVFKPGRTSGLRKILPCGDSVHKIKVDIAHTYAICGYGKDELASALVFLAIRCNVWGHGNMEKLLDLAYDSFQSYCKERKKTSSIMEFSKQELKITSCFGYIVVGIPLAM